MQVFTPYQSPLKCAIELWPDKKRYNKQLIECQQILDAINGKKAWHNHPVTKMYAPHKEWLEAYMLCLKFYRAAVLDKEKGMGLLAPIYEAEAIKADDLANSIMPSFLTDEFCDQHKRRLFTKSNELYPQYQPYGESEENWYYVNGKIAKYINGKRIE